MKRLFFMAILALCVSFSVSAQTVITNDYGSPIKGADGQNIDDDEEERISAVGLSYYFDNVVGINIKGASWNAADIEISFMADTSFKSFSTFFMPNYSMGIWKQGENRALITLAGGLSVQTYDQDNKTKVNLGLVIDPQLNVKLGGLVLSAGYAVNFNKFKFNSENTGKSFHVGVGITI